MGAVRVPPHHTGKDHLGTPPPFQISSMCAAALKSDSSVVVWGLASPIDTSAIQGQLAGGVQAIYPASYAFAALKDDGFIQPFWNHGSMALQHGLLIPW